MDTINEKKKRDILFHAEILMYYNELLIQQCDSWLSEEEGYESMIRIYETKLQAKREAERKEMIQKLLLFIQSIIQPWKKIYNLCQNTAKLRV